MNGTERDGWPFLAEIRRSRKVSLEQIAANTRIRLDYLTAIEQGDFEKLPGGIYTTSYIRQYARLIEFPEQELVTRFSSARETPAETPLKSQGDLSRCRGRLRFLRWLSAFPLWAQQRDGNQV